MSWTWSGDSNNVRQILSWAAASNGSNLNIASAKVPSKIRYRRGKPYAWGFNLEDTDTFDNITFDWFKLILDYDELPGGIKASRRVQSTYAKLRKYGNGDPIETAVQVTADYLRLLWNNVLEAIQEEMGQGWIDGLLCKVVITKPAIWSQEACSRTEQAARMAIIPNKRPFRRIDLELIAEPEAAAHAVLGAPEVILRPDLTKVTA